MTAPLSGITVVDLSRVLAGPYCTMVLAELGATVIKVERPDGGDDARAIGPFYADGRSAYFDSLNRAKRSIALNLKQADDRALFEKLVAKADVLVENFRPGTMERLGLGYPQLQQRHPDLIYAAISGFGQTGPYRDRAAYDMVAQAMGGIMSLTGWPGRPPTRVGASIGDIAAGLFAATGICSALAARPRIGRLIDVAMFDGQIALLENAIARTVVDGTAPGPLGARHPSITPFAAFSAQDGWLVIAAGNDRLFQQLCDCLGRPELAAEPRFATNAARGDHVEALHGAIDEALATAPVAAWLDRLQAAGVPAGPINTVAQAIADPQTVARGMIVQAGALKMAGNPIKMTGLAERPDRAVAPNLDGDRAQILAWLDTPQR
ncbi:MAG: CaiB/BaiF CoA transferase family protein [Rhodothalassiaceae bacterium]